MRIGIVTFPGTTCERDTYLWCKRTGHNPFFIHHTETSIEQMDFLILPGGFAFGDREYSSATDCYIMNPGGMALETPVMRAIESCVHKIPILGICNGFQILVRAGILQGELCRNVSDVFFCDHVECYFVNSKTDNNLLLWNHQASVYPSIDIPIAHGYGRYQVTSSEYKELTKDNQIFLKYTENVNGSSYSVAGVCNRERTVWGMMPHPERSPHSETFMRAIETYVKNNF